MVIGRDGDALRLLQYLRNEAHLFGITFHRNQRSKGFIKSELDEIPNIGEATTNNNFLDLHKETLNDLITTKFSTWAWNYGYNPNYQFNKYITLSNGEEAKLSLQVEKGIITKVEYDGNNKEFSNILLDLLSNAPHSREKITKIINENQSSIERYINGNNLISSLF